MKCKLSKLFFLALIGAISMKGYSQTEAERKKIVEGYDLKALKELSQRFNNEYNASYTKALEIAKEKNLPIQGRSEDGSYFELKGIDSETGELLYYKTFNNTPANSSVQTARSQHLYSGGSLGINVQGQGMILGIWDGGQPQASHPNLGLNRVSNKDGDNSPTTAGQDGIDHATHVAGTMIGSGASVSSARGIAFGGFLWANNWANDLYEMGLEAGEGLLVSNHSYGVNNVSYLGNPGEFGRYNQAARDLDAMMFLADKYQPVFAAGNDRRGVVSGGSLVELNPDKSGYDLMVNETASKNAVVVAAVNGFTNYTTPTAVVMSSFSQWGPTDDYRVKPDISAKGVDVYSSDMPTSTSVNSYRQESGTSMAAPSVTAVFALWQQRFKQLWPAQVSMRSASVRALMAHTASQAYGSEDSNVPGPNAKFGWGVINAEGGAVVLNDAFNGTAVFQERTLLSGETYELLVNVDGTKPLVATIAWTDKEGNVVSSADSQQSVLVNDLDLRIVRPFGANPVVLPYALKKSTVDRWAEQADNNVDTIEKVEYFQANGSAPAATYTVRVTHKGGALDSGSQKYTLIVTGGITSFGVDPLSIEKVQFDNLKIYPNPATDILNISAEISSIENAKISIFDVLGKKVYESDSLFNFNNEAAIDVSGFQAGVYLIQILKADKIETKKVVIK